MRIRNPNIFILLYLVYPSRENGDVSKLMDVLKINKLNTVSTSSGDYLFFWTVMDWCSAVFSGRVIVLPACHTLWLPASLKCSVHISSSAWPPSPRRRRLRAAWCPSSGPGCRGRRSGEPRSPTTGTLVKTLQLSWKFLSDNRTIPDFYLLFLLFVAHIGL